MSEAFAGVVEEYESAVALGQSVRAVAVVERLMDEGMSGTAVLSQVIGEVQRRAGARWLTGEWTVPQEHAATSIAAVAAASVARRLDKVPASRGRVVLVCPEGEWHAVPAMLLGGAVREAGWDVTLLGASTPASRLGRFLQDLAPVATGVSSSVYRSLSTARHVIEASTGAGVPVLAGGAAFGPGPERATRLGATGWAADARSAVNVLAGLPDYVDPVAPLDPECLAEKALLERRHDTFVDAGADAWRSSPVEPGVQRELVAEWLWALGAALLVEDAGPLREQEAWIGEVLEHRGGRRADVADLRVRFARLLAASPRVVKLIAAAEE